MNSKYGLVDCVNVNRFKELCKQLQHTEWAIAVQNKPKLRTYIRFKTEFSTENHIKYRSKYARSLMSQLRCGVLPLEIETGRYRGIKAEERICRLCELNQVEDEFHFLCNCTLYKELRKTLYDKAEQDNAEFAQLSDMSKFIFLMQKCKYTIKYVELAYNKRKLAIYKSV